MIRNMKFLWVLSLLLSVLMIRGAPYGNGPPVLSIKDSTEQLYSHSSTDVDVEQDLYNPNSLKVSLSK